MIHETAIVAPDAIIGHAADIGPYSVIGVDGRPNLNPVSIGSSAIVRSHTVIYRGTEIGEAAAFGHGVLVREKCIVGHQVSIGSHTVVEHTVTIGDGVRLHSNCFVPEESVLEDGAWLGPGVIVTNAKYPNRPDTKQNLEGVYIGQDATIGANAILMPGVQIGRGALVGAGTVVLRDVGAGERVVGNPGRPL